MFVDYFHFGAFSRNPKEKNGLNNMIIVTNSIIKFLCKCLNFEWSNDFNFYVIGTLQPFNTKESYKKCHVVVLHVLIYCKLRLDFIGTSSTRTRTNQNFLFTNITFTSVSWSLCFWPNCFFSLPYDVRFRIKVTAKKVRSILSCSTIFARTK